MESHSATYSQPMAEVTTYDNANMNLDNHMVGSSNHVSQNELRLIMNRIPRQTLKAYHKSHIQKLLTQLILRFSKCVIWNRLDGEAVIIFGMVNSSMFKLILLISHL